MKIYSLSLGFVCLWFGFWGGGQAAELFGISLSGATRDQLRAAVKQSGMTLIREAGDDEFFDVYDSQTLLPGSSRLYLGFVKSNQRFAFAEYEFNGLRQPIMLQKLRTKYGEPQLLGGKYLTDQRYQWSTDEVQISLTVDWAQHKTRLLYYQPAALDDLRQEQKAYRLSIIKQQDKTSEQLY